MKFGVKWDEVYPVFFEEITDYSDANAEVTSEWIEEFRTVSRRFWQMQGEIEKLIGWDY